jgi:hypothetical protein
LSHAYIPAVLTSDSRSKVTSKAGRVTKSAIKHHISENPESLEFISRSHFHHYGQMFRLAAAVRAFGPVSVEVRDAERLVAVVTFDGDKAAVR